MADCPFCNLAARRPGFLRWHDGDAIFSIKPFGAVNAGHRMFIPAAHLANAAADPDMTGRCFAEAARWAQDLGHPFNLVVNSGVVAGQSVQHLHVHYVPRKHGDGLGYRWRHARELEDKEDK